MDQEVLYRAPLAGEWAAEGRGVEEDQDRRDLVVGVGAPDHNPLGAGAAAVDPGNVLQEAEGAEVLDHILLEVEAPAQNLAQDVVLLHFPHSDRIGLVWRIVFRILGKETE